MNPSTVDERELVIRANAGDQQAFDLLYDRYFARTAWYFYTIFPRREAKKAVTEVLTALFGSLAEPFDGSLAERAYRLAVATELRHASRPKPAKVESAKHTKARRTG